MPNMRFMSECCVCWASGLEIPEAEFSRAREVDEDEEVGFVGEVIDFEERREASNDLSGDTGSMFEDCALERPGSSTEVLFCGDTG